MDRNTANVSFYCRESKKNKDGMAPFELSLVINGKRCYIQFVFTELGVAMLSSVLKSETAIQANIGIMRAFSQVRQYLMAASTVSA